MNLFLSFCFCFWFCFSFFSIFFLCISLCGANEEAQDPVLGEMLISRILEIKKTETDSHLPSCQSVMAFLFLFLEESTSKLVFSIPHMKPAAHTSTINRDMYTNCSFKVWKKTWLHYSCPKWLPRLSNNLSKRQLIKFRFFPSVIESQ